jgi:hypothetical protein
MFWVQVSACVPHASAAERGAAFDGSGLEPALGTTLLANFDDILATRDTLLNGVVFPDEVIDEVTEFMKALTDPAARERGRRRARRALPVPPLMRGPATNGRVVA